MMYKLQFILDIHYLRDLYTLNEIQHMECTLDALKNLISEKYTNFDAKLLTEKRIHEHLMEVAKNKENSPLMREVESLLKSNPFGKGK